MGVGGQRHAPAAFTPGKDPVPLVQEAGWAPGPVWIVAENLAPTGIRSPDRPASRYTDWAIPAPNNHSDIRETKIELYQFLEKRKSAR